MGQELLDLHQAHTEGAVSAEEYQVERQGILTRFNEYHPRLFIRRDSAAPVPTPEVGSLFRS